MSYTTNEGTEGPVGVPAVTVYEGGMVPPADYYSVTATDPNWKSQKTRRKSWRRLSNAPKAVRKRMGFKERRG